MDPLHHGFRDQRFVHAFLVQFVSLLRQKRGKRQSLLITGPEKRANQELDQILFRLHSHFLCVYRHEDAGESKVLGQWTLTKNRKVREVRKVTVKNTNVTNIINICKTLSNEY